MESRWRWCDQHCVSGNACNTVSDLVRQIRDEIKQLPLSAPPLQPQHQQQRQGSEETRLLLACCCVALYPNMGRRLANEVRALVLTEIFSPHPLFVLSFGFAHSHH